MAVILDLIEILFELSRASQSRRQTLTEAEFGRTYPETILLVSSMFDQAVEDVSLANFKNVEKQQRYGDELKAIQIRFIERSIALSTDKSGEFMSRSDLALLQAIYDALEETNIYDNSNDDFSLEILGQELLALRKSVGSLNVNTYLKRALLIEMTSLINICDAGQIYSEYEIRRRIKILVADFAAEFDNFDDEYKKVLERFTKLYRKLYPAVAVLALTADAVTIAGLLTSS